MQIDLNADWMAALEKFAAEKGVSPKDAVKIILSRTLGPYMPPFVPKNDWERRLLAMGTNCGVSLTDEQVGREYIYED